MAKKDILRLIEKFIYVSILTVIFSISLESYEKYFIKNISSDWSFDEFKYERTNLGKKEWELFGKYAWMYNKVNKVELYNGKLNIYDSKLVKTKKINIEFLNGLLSKKENNLRLENKIKMVVQSDTNLILKTSRLFYDGKKEVKNTVQNDFFYGLYKLKSLGIKYNTENKILNLQSKVKIFQGENDYIYADSGRGDLKSNRLALKKIYEARYDNYFFKADNFFYEKNNFDLEKNVEISKNGISLKTNKLNYNKLQKIVNMPVDFKINFTDKNKIKYFYEGKGFVYNIGNKAGTSEKAGVIYNDTYLISFDHIFIDETKIELKGKVVLKDKINFYELNTEHLILNHQKFKIITEITSVGSSEIIKQKKYKLHSNGMKFVFDQNSIKNILLCKDVKGSYETKDFKCDSAVLELKNNMIETIYFNSNVVLNYENYKLKTLNLKLNMFKNRIKNLITSNEFVIIENDTYLIRSNMLNINSIGKDSYSGKIDTIVTIFNKFNKSKLNCKELYFKIIENKIKSIKLNERINGSIFIKKT